MDRHRLLLKALSVFCALSFFAAFSTWFAVAVVFTPGGFRVSETGAAVYEIPIKVPPGTAGMEPKLSLVYNSQQGNGVLGVGWSLSGLSAVTRCPRTLAQDGISGSVNYDWDDRFCLDGQRLIAISGAYGQAGTEYRTERESFSKIISYGIAGNGPAYFTVWTKSGQVLEFGNTADSRIEAQGKPTVRVWALNRATDYKGNYFEVWYDEDSGNGDYVPTRIAYSSYEGSAHYATVEFYYQPRADIAPGDVVPLYVAGSLIQVMKRLTNVQTKVTASYIRDYRLSYEAAPVTGRLRLTRVLECDGNGANCLLPIYFTWQNGGNAYVANPWTGHGLAGSPQLVRWVDMNGDGRADYTTTADGVTHYVSLSTGSGYSAQGAWYGPGLAGSNELADWVDLDGDGKVDFVSADGAGAHYVTLSTGTSYGAPLYWPGWGLFGSTRLARWVDLNGDGRMDYVSTADGITQYVSLSTGSGYDNQIWYGPGLAGADTLAQWVDLNGDGKADFVSSDGAGGHYVVLSTGTGFSAGQYWPGWGLLGPVELSRWVDLNGDGKKDYVTTADGITQYIGLSTGISTENVIWYGAGIGGPTTLVNWVDLNGDGKADYTSADGLGTHYISFSMGGSYASGTAWTGHGVSSVDLTKWVDLDGDGKADYTTTSGNGTHYVSLSAGPFPDLLTTITSSMGSTITISYLPLTDDTGVYTKGDGAVYPVVDVKAPFYVVRTAQISNGIGGVVTTSYSYSGLRVSQDGRGLLGFAGLLVTDSQTGIRTSTSFRQDWPFVGLPSQVTRTTPDGLIALSQADNFYACKDLDADPENCTVAIGKRYFTYVSRSSESSRELNDAFLSRVCTTNQFDLYGNATLIEVAHQQETGAACPAPPGALAGSIAWKTTTNIYADDPAKWILGRLTRSTVVSSEP